jgi:hypothetical protein
MTCDPLSEMLVLDTFQKDGGRVRPAARPATQSRLQLHLDNFMKGAFNASIGTSATTRTWSLIQSSTHETWVQLPKRGCSALSTHRRQHFGGI